MISVLSLKGLCALFYQYEAIKDVVEHQGLSDEDKRDGDRE
jgi:hypothetical protein